MSFVNTKANDTAGKNNQLKGKITIALFHGYPMVLEAVLSRHFKGGDYFVFGYNNRSISSGNINVKMRDNGCSVEEILIKTSDMLFEKQLIKEAERYVSEN